MSLSEELTWRGFVNQTTLKDISLLDTEPMMFYWGVDPSSDSMTIGNLVIAIMIRHFIDHGHKAVLLIGGATGLIGDPDGKNDERLLLPNESIKHNKAAIVAQYGQIFRGKDFEVVDNYDWFQRLGYLNFLRTIGKFVPMRQMLGREFVQKRLGQAGSGISYAEFSYVLIQAYDFLHLYQTKAVKLQVCGADQWGNSIAGVELIRRIAGGEAHVWAAPLVVDASTGAKFGKSEIGAIWLDPSKTSVYKFYQFWLNVDDDSAERFLKLYTFLSRIEIEEIINKFRSDKSSRLAQKTLAYEVTKLVHGQKQALLARTTTEVLFGRGLFLKLSKNEISMLKKELLSAKVSKADSLADILVRVHLAESLSDANRLVTQGAIALNQQKCQPNQKLQFKKGSNLLQRGKNNFAIIDY